MDLLQNPITGPAKDILRRTKSRIHIAVPFLSTFASSLLTLKYIARVPDKKIIVRLDSRHITTYDLEAMEWLLDNGFKIRYDTTTALHLKLYIFDDTVFISSSNLTKSGFENNDELTILTDTTLAPVNDIFADLWDKHRSHRLTKRYIKDNWNTYRVLKCKKSDRPLIPAKRKRGTMIGKLKIDQLIDHVFVKERNQVPNNWQKHIDEASHIRTQRISALERRFNSVVLFAPIGHPRRRNCLWHDFLHGAERRLAGTGLRNDQLGDAFEHPSMKHVIEFMWPKPDSGWSWDLSNLNDFRAFCNGIFDFDIKQYKDTLPIRLASYFYPEHFVPIFKFDTLEEICSFLGMIDIPLDSKGDRLFVFNYFISQQFYRTGLCKHTMSYKLYQCHYTVKLYRYLIDDPDGIDTFIKEEKQKDQEWIENHIRAGDKRLIRMGCRPS